MNALIALVRKVLDKTDQLLTTEPARLIGYGAAVVVVLAVKAIEFVRPGLIPQVGFNDAVGVAFTAMASLVILVESIRRFVYSPMTYIEDLSDESQFAHEAAHEEEDARRFFDKLRQAAAEDNAAKAAPEVQTVNIGSVNPTGSKGQAN